MQNKEDANAPNANNGQIQLCCAFHLFKSEPFGVVDPKTARQFDN